MNWKPPIGNVVDKINGVGTTNLLMDKSLGRTPRGKYGIKSGFKPNTTNNNKHIEKLRKNWNSVNVIGYLKFVKIILVELDDTMENKYQLIHNTRTFTSIGGSQLRYHLEEADNVADVKLVLAKGLRVSLIGDDDFDKGGVNGSCTWLRGSVL